MIEGDIMKKLKNKMKIIVALVLAMGMMTMSVCAAEPISPRFSNVASVSLSIDFDMNNVVYCTLAVAPYSHGSGVSGLMKLYDSDGNCLKIWSVSDYERPIVAEFTYQGVYGEEYTAVFTGYAYSNNGTAADRLELEISAVCED